jgi:mRNA-degrading endonuclease RelE of RelBE toxin-antitoxin system
MSYKVTITATSRFLTNAKRLAKKYSSLKGDLIELNNQLIINPTLGVQIKKNIYKIRLAIKSKNKGKSGGARVITYYFDENETQIELFLLTIYDKSSQSEIEDYELSELITNVEKIIEDRNLMEEE